jgi:hypothetical protein
VTERERNARRRIAYHLRKRMRALAGKPVQWGSDDCVMLHADVHVAAGLKDPVKPMRGKWLTPYEAEVALGDGGLLGALQGAAKRCGWKRIRVKQARIGDVGLCVWDGGATVVTKLHPNEWIARTDGAYAVLPDKAVKVAWSTVR